MGVCGRGARAVTEGRMTASCICPFPVVADPACTHPLRPVNDRGTLGPLTPRLGGLGNTWLVTGTLGGVSGGHLLVRRQLFPVRVRACSRARGRAPTPRGPCWDSLSPACHLPLRLDHIAAREGGRARSKRRSTAPQLVSTCSPCILRPTKPLKGNKLIAVQVFRKMPALTFP